MFKLGLLDFIIIIVVVIGVVGLGYFLDKKHLLFIQELAKTDNYPTQPNVLVEDYFRTVIGCTNVYNDSTTSGKLSQNFLSSCIQPVQGYLLNESVIPANSVTGCPITHRLIGVDANPDATISADIAEVTAYSQYLQATPSAFNVSLVKVGGRWKISSVSCTNSQI